MGSEGRMTSAGFSKLERRWAAERVARAERSARLRRLLIELGLPVLQSYGARRVWLFGSVAAGTAGTASDIDLLADPVATEDYWALRRDLEAAIGHPVDLYTQDDDADLVRKIIERGDRIDEVQP